MDTYKPRYPKQPESEQRLFDPSVDKMSPDVPEPASPEPKKKAPPPPKPPKKMAKGGYVRAADGCAQRGKTKGRMV